MPSIKQRLAKAESSTKSAVQRAISGARKAKKRAQPAVNNAWHRFTGAAQTARNQVQPIVQEKVRETVPQVKRGAQHALNAAQAAEQEARKRIEGYLKAWGERRGIPGDPQVPPLPTPPPEELLRMVRGPLNMQDLAPRTPAMDRALRQLPEYTPSHTPPVGPLGRALVSQK